MKRIIGLLLMVCMAASLCTSALAADADSAFTPVYNWDDAQWETAKSWTGSEWYAYFEWVDEGDHETQWYIEYYDQLYRTQNSWGEERIALYEDAEEAYIDEYIRRYELERKAANGFPYPDGVNIKVDENFANFSVGEPVVKNGVTFAPAEEMAVMLGGHASLVQDGALVLTKGDASLAWSTKTGEWTATKNNVVDEAFTAAAAYVDGESGKVFLPVRSVAVYFGYNVYWDYYDDVVAIFDKDALIEKVDAQFTILNKVFVGQRELLAKTLENNSRLKAEIVLYGDGETDTRVAATLDAATLSKGMNVQADVTLNVDINQIRDILLLAAQEEDIAAFEKNYSKSNVSILLNVEENVLYMKGSLVEQQYPTLTKGAWVKIPLDELYGMGFEAYAELMEKDMTVGTLLFLMMEDSSYSLGTLYEDINEAADTMALFYGDSMFVKSHTGTGTTYTLTQDTARLAKALSSMGLMDEEEAKSLPEIRCKLTMTERDGKIVQLEADGKIVFAASLGEMNFYAKGDMMQMEARMELKGRFLGKIVITSTSNTKETQKEVPAQPAGTIVDVEDIYDAGYEYALYQCVEIEVEEESV